MPHRSTPVEQTWPARAKRKRISAERLEQQARTKRLEAEEFDRKYAAYCAQRDANDERVSA
jgi:hypothetical protein